MDRWVLSRLNTLVDFTGRANLDALQGHRSGDAPIAALWTS